MRDTTPPVLSCAPSITNECGTGLSFTPPSAVDACDGTNVTIRILSTVTNTSGFACPLRFSVTRTWSASDSCANSNVCSQTITFRDTTAPDITCATNLVIECGAAWSFAAPSAFDLCDGTNIVLIIQSTVTNTATVGCPTNLVAVRTWRATDQCGNFSTCSQTITVVDTTPPALTCSANVTIECGAPLVFSVPAVFDNCDGTNIALVISEHHHQHRGAGLPNPL